MDRGRGWRAPRCGSVAVMDAAPLVVTDDAHLRDALARLAAAAGSVPVVAVAAAALDR